MEVPFKMYNDDIDENVTSKYNFALSEYPKNKLGTSGFGTQRFALCAHVVIEASRLLNLLGWFAGYR